MHLKSGNKDNSDLEDVTELHEFKIGNNLSKTDMCLPSEIIILYA